MKKTLFVHFSFFFAYFVIVTVFRGWFSFSYIPFWIGGMLGTLMPDIDYLIYSYYLRPTDHSSKVVTDLVSERKFSEAVSLSMQSNELNPNLVLHNVPFQLIFVIFTFLIMTSGNLVGRGIVLGFLLHLLVDQITLLTEKGDFQEWFQKLPFDLDKKQRQWYFWTMVVVTMAFGIFF